MDGSLKLSNKLEIKKILCRFKSLDKELTGTVTCVLKGCHKVARYSFQLALPYCVRSGDANDDETMEKKGYICSKHIKEWNEVRRGLVEDYFKFK